METIFTRLLQTLQGAARLKRPFERWYLVHSAQ